MEKGSQAFSLPQLLVIRVRLNHVQVSLNFPLDPDFGLRVRINYVLSQEFSPTSV